MPAEGAKQIKEVKGLLYTAVVDCSVRVPIFAALLNPTLLTKHCDRAATQRRHIRCNVARKQRRPSDLHQLLFGRQNCLGPVLKITHKVGIEGIQWLS